MVKAPSNSAQSPVIIFLLYVSVMFIITFLQQEFVLVPELQNIDIVGEESKALMLEKFQKWRWLAFLIPPVLLLTRLSLVTLCLYIGSFFSTGMSSMKFKTLWVVAIKAQSIMLVYSALLCVINIVLGTNQSMAVTRYTSLLFMGSDSMESWIKMPLAAVNVFEIAYWIAMALFVSKLADSDFNKSFKFVMSSYGVGYLFYILLMMFLVLYLG